jgi:hypothetical protein
MRFWFRLARERSRVCPLDNRRTVRPARVPREA